MKNLLITTFGEFNKVEYWLNGERNFDVALLNYDYHDERPTLIGDLVWHDSFGAFKYPGIASMFKDEPRLFNYDYYWMPDDDIELPAKEINTLFDKMRTLNLDLAQPSIEKSDVSFPSWEHFVYREGLDIVLTNFVEVMCPAFSRLALLKCIDTFPKSNSGWGLDIVWPKLIGDTGNNIAIINSVVAKHTRPVGSGCLYADLQRKGISAYREKRRLMAEYGVSSVDIKTHGCRISDNNV